MPAEYRDTNPACPLSRISRPEENDRARTLFPRLAHCPNPDEYLVKPDHNPYAPPKATVASTKPAPRVKPRSVQWAMTAPWAAFALTVVHAAIIIGIPSTRSLGAGGLQGARLTDARERVHITLPSPPRGASVGITDT